MHRSSFLCYLCYWDLIPEEYCRFSGVSALFSHKYPYAPLVILYFTVADVGRVGRRFLCHYTCFSQYLGLH